jgi:hypothetical protein
MSRSVWHESTRKKEAPTTEISTGAFRSPTLNTGGDYFFAGAAAPPAVFWKLYVPPNFLLNRSSRPAVSTNFCLPVKNGWHELQMSTVILASVLRVVKVLPHAQWAVQAW